MVDGVVVVGVVVDGVVVDVVVVVVPCGVRWYWDESWAAAVEPHAATPRPSMALLINAIVRRMASPSQRRESLLPR